MADKNFIKIPTETKKDEMIIPVEDIVLVKRSLDSPKTRSIIGIARGDFYTEVNAEWSLEEIGRRLNARVGGEPPVP